METIYDAYVKAAEKGRRCEVDLIANNMKVDGRYLIKGGAATKGLNFINPVDTDEQIRLYSEYKHSVPSEKSERHRHPYFKALPLDKLTDEDLVTGEDREVARAKLEGWVLCAKLGGQLEWNPAWGTWFWQSEEDPDFVILKQWLAL